MESTRKPLFLLPVAALLLLASLPALRAQSAPAPAPPPSVPSMLDRINQMMGTGPASGPAAWTPSQLSTLVRLRDAALSDPWALSELRHLTDNIGPRLSGSPQSLQAVHWVADEMRALGAEVTLEPAKVPHWVRGAETGELVSWPGQTPGATQKVVLTALGPSVATPPEGLTADLIVVPDFAALAALNPADVKGKILLFNHPFDKELAAAGNGGAAYGGAVVYRGAGPAVAAPLGAVAVHVRSAGGADFRLPHTGQTDYEPNIPPIPAAAVAAEDAETLANLASQGPVRLHLTLTPQTFPPADSFNVIADFKGSEHPEQVVVVSGHLDSWDLGTGAIDDGAGIAVSMQVIHLMKQLNLRPRRTIRFIAWMAEEQGGEGAQFYNREYKDQFAQHVGALESDLGSDHPTGIYVAGKPELRAWLRPVAGILDSFGAGRLTESGGVGEDVDGMTQAGVPSFAPIFDSRFYFNYHHSAADTFDKVNPKTLNENAAVMTVLAYALADSPNPAPR